MTVNPNTTQISGGATAYGLTTGALTLNGPAIFNVSNNGTGTGTLTVGTIAGAFTITKTGAGNLVTNSTVSGYTAPVSILAGNVGWANASATITESQVFSGAGGIIKSGAGTVNLTSANTFTGGVTTTAGVLQFATVGNNGGTTATNLGQGTNGLTLSGGTLSFIGDTSQSTNRAVTLTAATSTLSADGVGGATITYNGVFLGTTVADVTLVLSGSGDGFITSTSFAPSLGTGDLTKTGSGTWTISGTGTKISDDDVLVNAGTLTLTGSAKAVDDDVIVNGNGTVLNLNTTGVLVGNSGTSAGLYSRAGAVININADDPYSTTTGLDFILLGDTSGTGTLNTNTFNITTPRLDVGQDSTGFIGAITGSGTVTVGTSANLYQGTIGSGVSLLGAGNVYKLGAGTLTLSGVISGMTGVTGAEVHSGILALDYTTNNAAKFVAARSLNMSGGILTLSGNASADTFETVAGLNLTTGGSVTLTGGSSEITLLPGGSQKVALSLGDITRPVGGSTIQFNLPTGIQDAANGFVTTQANTNGIIGGYATVNNGVDPIGFATNSGGNIIAVTATLQDDVTLWATAQNISDSSGFTGTLNANTNITSLRFNAAAVSTVTIATGVVLNLSSGGILQTTNAGGISTIAGGRLQSGAGSELIFNVNSLTQRLDVTSQITGSASVTKGGAGTLLLNSANNFYSGITSVLGGTLQVSGGNAIGDHSDLVVGGGQTSTFQLLADEIIGNLTLGGENGSTAGVGVVSSINLGSSRLTFNQETALTMVGVLFTSGTGGTLVKSGSATWTNQAANPGFQGTFVVDQGLAVFSANVNNLSAASAIILNGSGSSLRLDNDQTAAVGSRIADAASVTLNNTAGVTADALGFYMRRTAGTTTGTETLGQLILNAGHNVIAADATGATRIATINFTNATPLVRNNFATLLVVGRSLGDTTATQRGNVNFATNPGGSIGGGGAAGTTTITIFPYVIGESTAGAPSGAVNFGNSFVRYAGTGAPNGFRPLTTAEYVNDSAAPATGTNNVRYTANNSITTPAAINSLVLDSGSAITLTGSATSMEITSGA
ncbi:MAG: autotransporter-associated beta strand repeat-containing protein, partial [Gammaproteobacteria bacterium]|nr:autotransporter-associated beta strand repeat-containing protein [Gammaproteobacteria bacterium]